MKDGVRRLGGSSPITGTSSTEPPVASHSPPPPASEEIRVDLSLINPPNRQFEVAWEVKRKLQALLHWPSSWTASDAAIAAASGHGGLDVSALIALIDRLFPKALTVDPTEAAKAIRELPPEELKTALSDASEAKAQRIDVLLATAPRDLKIGAIVDRGRAILEKLATTTNEKELAFLAAIQGSAASIGLLAEAYDAKTAASFLAKIRSASATRLEEMISFVERDLSFRSAIQAMAPRPLQIADPTPVVLSQQFGIDEKSARAAAGSQLTAAREALAPLIAGLPLGGFDPYALLVPGTHVADGGLILDRTAPFNAIKRVAYAEEQALEEAVRVLGDQLGSAIVREPALKKLAALIEMPEHPRAQRLLLSSLIEHYGASRDPSETRAQFLRRLLSADVLPALRSDFLADPAAWLEDFGAFRSTLVEIEATEREAERARSELRRQLDGGVLRLPADVKKSLEAHMIASYPNEGIGYVLSDGASMIFHPIKNDAEDATRHGVQNNDDLAKMNALLESTGWFVLGMAHSHPNSRALFSPDDLDRMRTSVALSPGRRTIIVAVDAAKKTELASFASGPDGQVIGEDQIHVAR